MSTTAHGWPDEFVVGQDVPSAITIEPGRPLTGRLRVPGDKSISHRALLLGAKATGTSVIAGLSDGDDVRRTAVAMRALGATIGTDGDGRVTVTGGVHQLHEPEFPIEVGNSGTAIRLLAGFVAAYPWFVVLAGDASIAKRPMDRVVDPLRRMGAKIDGRDGGRFAPLGIRGGQLNGIDLRMPIASAQVKSAVLRAPAL